MSGTDKMKHTGEDLAGKAKEAAGKATGNDKLTAKGKAEQAAAKVKKIGDDVKDVFDK